MKIRLLTPEDAEQAAGIERICFTDPWTEHVYRQEIARIGENIWLFGAFPDNDEDRLSGTIGLTRMGDDGEIGNVAVLPECRRQGIAEQLLDFVLCFGQERLGMRNFTLEVRAGNEPAIRLYEKKGFREEGIRPGMYDHPKEDARIFWKRMEME